MNFMNKFEKKFGRYAIYDLHKYFVFASMIGLVLSQFEMGQIILSYLRFDMGAVLRGQVWRLFTWMFVFEGGFLNIIFLLCLIPMGKSLENFLGTFRMNVYLIGGVILNIVGGVLVYLVTLLTTGVGFTVYLSTYYILLSIFMALALVIPDGTVHLYFILPIKMKWMLVVYLLTLLYDIYLSFSMHWTFGIVYGTQIILALANLFLFVWIAGIRVDRNHRKRQRQFQAQMNSVPRPGTVARHTCAICGRTEKDNPDLMFRYCSKCSGNKEYCNDHLFTHEHM